MREDLTLFSAASLERDALEIRADLVPIAAELALKAGRHGVTSSDLRITAENRGLLTGKESEHRMNQISVRAVFRLAGLIATKQYRASDVRQAKGSPNIVYVTREFAEVA